MKFLFTSPSYLMDTRVWNIVLLSLQNRKSRFASSSTKRTKITTMSIFTVPSDALSDELHNCYVIKKSLDNSSELMKVLHCCYNIAVSPPLV